MSDFTMEQLKMAAVAVLSLEAHPDKKQIREVLADLNVGMKALGAVGFVEALAASIAKSRGIA